MLSQFFNVLSQMRCLRSEGSKVGAALLGSLCALTVSAGSAIALPTLTVLREAPSSSDPVLSQLESMGLSYQVLSPSQVSVETLREVDVLFLANLSALDDAQLDALGTWMQGSGGRVIVSGAFEGLTNDQLRQFRQLVGGYWSSSRPIAQPVIATTYPGNDWTDEIEDYSPVQGGVLIPSGIMSRLSATWTGEVGSPVAVLSTLQSVYMGWEWGEGGSAAETDQQWLLAALERFDDGRSAVISAQPAPQSTTVAPPVPTAPTSPVTSTPLGLPTPPPAPAQAPPATVIAPTSTTTPATTTARPSVPLLTPPPRAVPPPPSPTAAAAPTAGTGEEIYVSSLPVNTLEMLAMRQELEGLLGRVESALLTTAASSQESGGLPERYQSAIDQAHMVIDELPTWIGNGQHEQARREHQRAVDNLWTNYPVDQLTALPEVRAIWLDRGTIVDSASPAGLALVFDRLAEAGINTVFFETINAGYPVYPSRIAPQQNPLTRSWDPLAAAVQLAHERDMELHAWMWTFAVGNTRHNVLPEIGLPRDYIGPVLSANPSWSNYDIRGRRFPPGQPETWLDPANPQVRDYLFSMIGEMVTEYGVDGVHLDYIRYPFQNPGSRATFGYGTAARQQFTQLTGVDPTTINPGRDHELWDQWTAFRAERVSSFVEEAAARARSLNPQVVMSAAVYPMPNNERMQKLQQEWETWISRGDIDLLVPMTYVESSRRLEQLVRPTLAVTNESPVLLLPSLNLLDMPEVEFLDSMQAVRDLPTGGYSLFAARHLSEGFQSILNQSRIPSSQIPYREPFSATAFRFDVLRQEWDSLLSSEQMWIPERFQDEWMAQLDAVELALAGLAASPSQMSLEQARGEIANLQVGMEDWLRFEALERPYRVDTWTNRVVALDTLLRYGERRLPTLTSATPSTSEQEPSN